MRAKGHMLPLARPRSSARRRRRQPREGVRRAARRPLLAFRRAGGRAPLLAEGLPLARATLRGAIETTSNQLFEMWRKQVEASPHVGARLLSPLPPAAILPGPPAFLPPVLDQGLLTC